MSTALAQDELVADPWLAEQLGRPVYRLPARALIRRGAAEVTESVAQLLEGVSTPCLVYAKVPPEAIGVVQGLEQAEFRMVDTSITLERPPMSVVPGPGDYAVRLARPDDEGPVVELARQSFRFSRFHLDPQIADATADAIKAGWAANYFSGQRGDQLIVADSAAGVAGFLLALARPEGTMVIDLVAVDEAHRGGGVAGDMTRFAQNGFPDLTRLRVGTQLANIAALRAYQRLGFAIARAWYVFHRHMC